MLSLELKGYLPHHDWPPPTTQVAAEAIDRAIEQCPTLFAGLIFLARRTDERPAREGERSQRDVRERDQVSVISFETLAFALKWVHEQRSWELPGHGKELWDCVAQHAQGRIVSEENGKLMDAVSELDSSEKRREFWKELLSRFPGLLGELCATRHRPPESDAAIADFERPVKVATAAKIINKRSDLVLNELRRAECKTSPKGSRPAYVEHEDLCKFYQKYRRHHEGTER